MNCVIVNANGLLYAGFEGGKPVWRKMKSDKCQMEEAVADAVVRQLTDLGFTEFTKRNANGVVRKWVPEDLSAATLTRTEVK